MAGRSLSISSLTDEWGESPIRSTREPHHEIDPAHHLSAGRDRAVGVRSHITSVPEAAISTSRSEFWSVCEPASVRRALRLVGAPREVVSSSIDALVFLGALHDALAVHAARLHALDPESVDSMESGSIPPSSAWRGLLRRLRVPPFLMRLPHPPYGAWQICSVRLDS